MKEGNQLRTYVPCKKKSLNDILEVIGKIEMSTVAGIDQVQIIKIRTGSSREINKQ